MKMTDRDKEIGLAKLKVVTSEQGNMVMDRTDLMLYECEDCGKEESLRPYARGGKWTCYYCADKEPKVMEARAMHVMHGEPLPEGY